MDTIPSTPGAGPSSNPISRAASLSSHAQPDQSSPDSDEEWLGPFCEEIRQSQQEQFDQLMQHAEGKYRRVQSQLAVRYNRPGAPDGSSDAAYQNALEKLKRSFEARKQEIRQTFEEEASALIEKERKLRKLSMGAELGREETEALLREQDELFEMYQTQAHRSDSASAGNRGSASFTSISQNRPSSARSVTFQKSTTSEGRGVHQGKTGSGIRSQATVNLEGDLFPKERDFRSGRHAPWEVDASFPSSVGIHEEPDALSDAGTENNDETGTDEDEDDSGSNEDIFVGDFMVVAEGSAPEKSAPVTISRIGAHQLSSRGRSNELGRTPPRATTTPYLVNTTPLRQQSQHQSLDRKSNDAHTQHELWRPSQENIRPIQLPRRPSLLDTISQEDERSRDAERVRTEPQNTRARAGTGSISGAPGTSVSPSDQGYHSPSFVPSSTAALAQNKHVADASARFWIPPNNKASIAAASNVHAMASRSASSGSNAAVINSSSPVPVPTTNASSYRRRNDSDTSAGSPARWPSHHQIQAPTSSPKASPINTPGFSSSRRPPGLGVDSFAIPPSSPVTASLSASSTRRSPHVARPPSPSGSQRPSNASGISLSRQPTEIVDSSSAYQESRTSKFTPWSVSQMHSTEDVESLPSKSVFASEHKRGSASRSALSERMAKGNESDVDHEPDVLESPKREHEEVPLRTEQRRKHKIAESRHAFEEQQRKLGEDLLQAQREDREKVRQVRKELAALQNARDEEFAEQRRVLEEQRQRETELRVQKERELAEKEEELTNHKREMEEWLRIREEHEIAEQSRQLEYLKKREAILEEQQRLLEEQRQQELEEQRKREEELKHKVEELKRQQREFAEAQRRKEEREREEARKRQEQEALEAEQRRQEEKLRAEEEELRRKEREIHEREEALARRRKEEELRAKAEALERQRRELQQREEELARREQEEEIRRNEELARRQEEEDRRKKEEIERDAALRRQREEEDKKRLEVHMAKVLQKEREEEEREQRERHMREKEEKERQEKEELKERERRRQRASDEERRRQDERLVKETERWNVEEEEEDAFGSEDLKDQEELLRFYEQRKAHEEARKRPAGPSSSFSSSIPSFSSSSTSASGTFRPGRATSSASSIHSNWSGSQRSSASSSSSVAASEFSRASTGSSASSAWSSNTRPTASSAGSTGSNRTATTGEQPKRAPGAWKTSSASSATVGTPPSGPGMGSYTSSSPLSEAEWRRRQEEHAQRQQEQFRRDSLKSEQERFAQSAAATAASLSGREGLQRAWAMYESAWTSLKERPILYFRTFPWPTLRQPSSPDDLTANAIGALVLSPVHSIGKSNRDRIKAELLRWHPDRFESKWLPRVEANEKDNVRNGALQVTRALNELLGREDSDPFS